MPLPPVLLAFFFWSGSGVAYCGVPCRRLYWSSVLPRLFASQHRRTWRGHAVWLLAASHRSSQIWSRDFCLSVCCASPDGFVGVGRWCVQGVCRLLKSGKLACSFLLCFFLPSWRLLSCLLTANPLAIGPSVWNVCLCRSRLERWHPHRS